MSLSVPILCPIPLFGSMYHMLQSLYDKDSVVSSQQVPLYVLTWMRIQCSINGNSKGNRVLGPQTLSNGRIDVKGYIIQQEGHDNVMESGDHISPWSSTRECPTAGDSCTRKEY